jgi:hypothetical protein
MIPLRLRRGDNLGSSHGQTRCMLIWYNPSNIRLNFVPRLGGGNGPSGLLVNNLLCKIQQTQVKYPEKSVTTNPSLMAKGKSTEILR